MIGCEERWENKATKREKRLPPDAEAAAALPRWWLPRPAVAPPCAPGCGMLAW